MKLRTHANDPYFNESAAAPSPAPQATMQTTGASAQAPELDPALKAEIMAKLQAQLDLTIGLNPLTLYDLVFNIRYYPAQGQQKWANLFDSKVDQVVAQYNQNNRKYQVVADKAVVKDYYARSICTINPIAKPDPEIAASSAQTQPPAAFSGEVSGEIDPNLPNPQPLNNPFDLQKAIPVLAIHEGYSGHMYLDTKGFITVGHGFKIDNESQAKSYEFRRKSDGGKATVAEKIREFQRMQQVKEQKKSFNFKADSYGPTTLLTLDENYSLRELERKAKTHEDDLRNAYPELDSLPTPAQQALLSLTFNVGGSKLLGYKKTKAAVMAGDWKTAAQEIQSGLSPQRAGYLRDLLLDLLANP